jgi:hypothetical protein
MIDPNPASLSLSKGCPYLKWQGKPFDRLRGTDKVKTNQLNAMTL